MSGQMSPYFELLDAVNDAKTEEEHQRAEDRLSGWRDCMNHYGLGWSGTYDDRYTLAKYGEHRLVCCGVLLDWMPSSTIEGATND